MTRGLKIVGGTALAAVFAAAVVILAFKLARRLEVRSLDGAVVEADSDPRKQMPLANVRVTATGRLSKASAVTDANGFFHLSFKPAVIRGDLLSISFRHPGFEPLDLAGPAHDQIYVTHMTPVKAAHRSAGSELPIAQVRVRYTVQREDSVDIGSAVQTFEAVNTGDIPCAGHRPCSPDGKWKASVVTKTLDAGENNEFQNVRISCFAGPCPFTRIESSDLSQANRSLKVSVRNWSDTATFLIEAEVVHKMLNNLVRESYPAIFGRSMNFTLPPQAEGPSIEAELGGASIVFPLGPDLLLSWANCSAEGSRSRAKLFRCELKPGYRFQ